ncbi:MAG: VWA domain-containing protein [Candidatus Poribacteria bacterium]|nr:VWA domain-containing protein [Candidatus Poribacteria bacterium]
MNRFEKKQRSLNACLIAGILHVCFAILLTLFYYTHLSYEIHDVVAMEFIDMDKNVKQRTLKRPPKKPITQKQTKAFSEFRPKFVDQSASSNLMDETVRPSEEILMHNATETVSPTATELPDVTTQAKLLNSNATSIAKSVQSPFEITSGKGVESLRQRVKGDGDGGLHRLESKGTADIGSIGVEIGGSQGNDDGNGNSGTNPFGEALKQIADHIISTRELDKVNVVFVLDTSKSMQDNIQQVADNLFAMTDAFDLVNLEYHLGMSEFSVRREGQEIKTRALLPDVSMLRRRMKNVKLSGDENALDALIQTFDLIEFHADADRHLILVTDEQATTSLRQDDANETMRAKVIDRAQFEEVRVNVLGFPEPFQQTLSEATGGIWQEIPGSVRSATALPSNRVGNQKFLKFFREIAVDIRKSGNRSLFSLKTKFTAVYLDGVITIDKVQQELFNNGIVLKDHIIQSENAKLLQNVDSDLWVIIDRLNGLIYAIRREKNKMTVYEANYPDNWNLKENIVARKQQSGKRWVLYDQPNKQNYTFRIDKDLLVVHIGGQPGTASNTSSEPVVDIVVMLDYSRSMGGKSQAIMLGLSTLIGRLSIFPLKYRVGLIRFAEAKDAIKAVDGEVVSHMPLNEVVIERLLEDPFGGDEHLTNAIVDGIPKIRFSPYAQRFLLILTDEPTKGKYSAEQALNLCKSYGIKVYVIGYPDPDDLQTKLANQTKGLFYTMPNHLKKDYPNQ